MRFKLLILCLFYSTSNLSGQEYFEQKFDVAGQADLATVIVKKDTSLIILGVGRDSTTNLRKISNYEIDLRGDNLNNIQIIDSSASITSGAKGKKVIDGNSHVVPGYVYRTSTDRDLMLDKYNDNGDTIWHRVYDIDAAESLTSVVQVGDFYYCVGGTKGHDGSNFTSSKGLLFKVSKNGSKIWHKTYSFFDGQFDDVVESIDNKLIAVGYGEDPNEAVYVKLDTAGNVSWSKKIQTNGFDRLTSAVQLLDSSLIVAGSSDDSAYVAKIDFNGNFVWQTRLGSNAGIFNIIILSDGSIVGCGDGQASGTSVQGTVFKLCPTGELQWHRHYGPNDFPGHLYDIVELADGGFVTSGSTLGDSSGTQDIWVIGLDSIGCNSPSCDTPPEKCAVDGVSEGLNNKQLTIYPNPASRNFRIVLPKHISLDVDLAVALYDLTGKVMKDVEYRIFKSNIEVGAEFLDSGLYYVILKDERSFYRANVVIK